MNASVANIATAAKMLILARMENDSLGESHTTTIHRISIVVIATVRILIRLVFKSFPFLARKSVYRSLEISLSLETQQNIIECFSQKVKAKTIYLIGY